MHSWYNSPQISTRDEIRSNLLRENLLFLINNISLAYSNFKGFSFIKFILISRKHVQLNISGLISSISY